jgi:hypothetical protein
MFGNEGVLLDLGRMKISGLRTEGKHVVAMSMSEDHAVTLMSSGESFAVGSNKMGKLGIGVDLESSSGHLVHLSHQIASVACGSFFTLWVTVDNRVFVSGIAGALVPLEMLNVQATKCSAHGKSVALITKEGNVMFWPKFREQDKFETPRLLTKAASVSIADGRLVVLLENQILMALTTEGSSSVLYAVPRAFQGGERFLSASAAGTYTIAVDLGHRAWIFGAFLDFPESYLANNPAFESVIDVFAFPDFCCGITTDYNLVVLGRVPAIFDDRVRIFAKRPMPIDLGSSVSYVCGNGKDIVCLPLVFSREMALRQLESYVPNSIVSGMPVLS